MSSSGALCAVHGCRSSKRRDKKLSFFGFPSDIEMRKTWTELIARPDLAEKGIKRSAHFVCSLHFDPSVIKYIPQLQTNALPSRLLPPQATASSSSEEKKTKESSTQTNLTVINTIKNADSLKSTDLETTESLSSKKPRKRKKSSSTTVTSTTVENKTKQL